MGNDHGCQEAEGIASCCSHNDHWFVHVSVLKSLAGGLRTAGTEEILIPSKTYSSVALFVNGASYIHGIVEPKQWRLPSVCALVQSIVLEVHLYFILLLFLCNSWARNCLLKPVPQSWNNRWAFSAAQSHSMKFWCFGSLIGEQFALHSCILSNKTSWMNDHISCLLSSHLDAAFVISQRTKSVLPGDILEIFVWALTTEQIGTVHVYMRSLALPTVWPMKASVKEVRSIFETRGHYIVSVCCPPDSSHCKPSTTRGTLKHSENRVADHQKSAKVDNMFCKQLF